MNPTSAFDDSLGTRSAAARFDRIVRARLKAWLLTLIYAVFAVLWIVLSERAIHSLAPGLEELKQWSIAKGVVFVLATSVFLLLMLRRAFVFGEERAMAAATLASEKSFSEVMIESMPGIVYFYDFRGRFLRWNRNFESVSGYSREEIVRMHPLDFVSAEVRPLGQQKIDEVFKEGEAFVEAAFLTKSGRVIPYLFTARRVQFEDTLCLVGVGVDLTERGRAERMQLRLAAIVNSSEVAIISKTTEGVITTWNPGATRLFGYTEDEMLGEPITKLFPPELVHEEKGILERVGAGGAREHCETVRVRKDGSKIEVTMSLSPIFGSSGEIVGISNIANDITKRKRAERTLKELNESLEQRVAERTAELEAALVRAEAADRLKSAFLSTMSHELRTPLNSIIGFTGVLQQGLAGPLNEEQARQLGMVRGSARHLLELINDVLDLSKIEAGQMEVQAAPFDLREAVDRVAATVKPLAEAKNLDLTVDIETGIGQMVSDRRRVEQILLNLLANAVKFTDHGGVSLSVDLVETPGIPDGPARDTRFRVRDTGIGIRPHDLPTLFQPFHQLDSGLTRTHEGSGLGLAICRRLTTLLGGEISAVSEWTKGSEFTVRIPLKGGL